MINFKTKDISVLKALVVGNFKGQYKNSHLGVLWQFISPLIMVILFYVVFTSVRADYVRDEYWLLLCTGIFPYIFLESAIVGGSMCLVQGANMIKKINFPRHIIVFAHILTSFITFFITFTIVILICVLVNHRIDAILLLELLPLYIVTVLFGIGICLFLSSIVVYFRDLGYFINATSRLLFWISPTIYTIYDVSGILKTIMMINPLTYYISSFQEIVYFNMSCLNSNFIICIILSAIVLCVGYVTFNKIERGFAERL